MQITKTSNPLISYSAMKHGYSCFEATVFLTSIIWVVINFKLVQ